MSDLLKLAQKFESKYKLAEDGGLSFSRVPRGRKALELATQSSQALMELAFTLSNDYMVEGKIKKEVQETWKKMQDILSRLGDLFSKV